MNGGRPRCVRCRLCALAFIAAVLMSATQAGAAIFTALTRTDRMAIGRVALAEAADQSDAGLAAVVFVILNRLSSRHWGDHVDDLLNAKGQFEPVLRAGGDWRRLPSPTAVQQARIETIINLATAGRLPDPTKGAEYFQNPKIVAERVQAGDLPRSIYRFGGRMPSAVIGEHEFFMDKHNLTERPVSRPSDPNPIFITSSPGCLELCPQALAER